VSARLGPVVDDVTLEELDSDPYPFYARMRRESPVAYLPLSEQWLVTRWDDCQAIGIDATVADTADAVMDDYFGPSIITAAGDVHRWLRGGVDPPLRPRAIQGYMNSRARHVAREYVTRIRPRGRADATGELLELISVRVIGDVLGLRDAADETLQRWFHALSAGLTNFDADSGLALAARATMRELDQYVAGAIDRLTAAPDDSGLSSMVHAGTGDGGPRTFDDLIGTVRVIVLGGFQEPGHGAGASLLGLLSNPGQLAAAIADPDATLPLAVHEGLRWIAPFGVTGRRAIRDLKVGDVVIPEGARIALGCGSANHDETRYTRGELFDLGRPKVAHAAFGWGLHYCSGHFISRALEQVVLEEVLSGLPALRLDPDEPATVHGWQVRGVKRLPVIWNP